MRLLDRYLLRQYLRIFLVCVLGVPFLFIVIDLTDSIERYLDGVGRGAVLLHYLLQFPYWMLVAFPVAALLAAVFTISSMTRHFEITAAKASGVSFYRMAAPLLLAGLLISVVALAITELVPKTNRLAKEALGDPGFRSRTSRASFVYRGEEGRLYRIRRLEADRGRISDIQIEREGTGFGYPTYKVTAPEARWDSAAGQWVLEEGRVRFFPDPETTITLRFAELRQRAFTETPRDLLAGDRDPEEMGYVELGRFIESIQRSGGTALDLQVDRMLKIAYPLTCLIIVLFGAPLANSTRRGGATLAIGIGLGITMIFLILIRLAQALGAGGVLPPVAAAWLPNGLFLAAGLVLMVRVRT
ncbi:MAG: LptF/LptG family permease [Gemmatimonadota bacterium]